MSPCSAVAGAADAGLRIRDPGPADEGAWRDLWDGYNRFHGADVPDDVTAGTWRRLLDPSSRLFARLAAREDRVVGFSCSVLHPGTWSLESYCYLEDLFVDPAERGRGVGEALIRDLLDLGRSCGWRRIYWHTHADNATARRLYDRVTTEDGVVRYTVALA